MSWKRRIKVIAAGIFLALPWIGVVCAAEVDLWCLAGNGPPLQWAPCNQTNQLAISSALGNSYSTGAAGYTGYTSPTDIFSITGSATKTIKVINVRVSGFATADNHVEIALVKRSVANTGGTPTTITPTPWDSLFSAATATVVTYAAAPTLGALVGNVCACQVEIPAKSGVGGSILEWQFNRNGVTPIVLRGTNEMLALNLSAVTLPSGAELNITIEWVEQ